MIYSGQKCDEHGQPLPPDSAPPPVAPISNVWSPFHNEVQFRLADFLFRKVEMSQRDIDELMDLWALDLQKHEGEAPFDNHQALYQAINEIRVGSAPWKCFQTVVPPNLRADAPDWQKQPYQVWFRDPDIVIANILANRDFEKEFDTAPYVHLDANNKRRWSDFMSGNYSWRHAVRSWLIFRRVHSSQCVLFRRKYTNSITRLRVPCTLASYLAVTKPLFWWRQEMWNITPFICPSEICTTLPRRGHRNGVIPIAFLAIPKCRLSYLHCSFAPY